MSSAGQDGPRHRDVAEEGPYSCPRRYPLDWLGEGSAVPIETAVVHPQGVEEAWLRSEGLARGGLHHLRQEGHRRVGVGQEKPRGVVGVLPGEVRQEAVEIPIGHLGGEGPVERDPPAGPHGGSSSAPP